uniref:Lutropin subunit beta n=1 Tax=Coturnix japonica TaxID=93934 RepID=LSHB_COTJA|nr:RecName: Full=Lutropin subunit beta; Short=Lutropin beta chain; AltName: Full=Luteinizing hormone subunit beta; Short=LH-B; Short=LSH-B; Short=LSH-beta; Flags: Precursor [Coturnix japonica]pir/I51242/ luteinizing hormone beta-subunit - quail [Coturnix coturnix]AAB30867.1 luteinizing hormone beta-subunit [Coturnix coturnix]
MGGAQVLLLLTLLGTPLVTHGTPPLVVDPSIGSQLGLGSVLGLDLGSMGGSGRPPCRPINVTVAVEKEECPQCMAVTTTACGGYCRTREPVYRSPLGPPPQSSCTYGALRYERWDLWGCPIGSDPKVILPVALSCRCARCPIATSDCTVQGLGPAFCGAPGGFGGQ